MLILSFCISAARYAFLSLFICFLYIFRISCNAAAGPVRSMFFICLLRAAASAENQGCRFLGLPLPGLPLMIPPTRSCNTEAALCIADISASHALSTLTPGSWSLVRSSCTSWSFSTISVYSALCSPFHLRPRPPLCSAALGLPCPVLGPAISLHGIER